MATPTTMTAPAVRRGSFFETWRLFASGAGRTWFIVLAMFIAFAIPFWFASHGRPIAFVSCALLIVFAFGWATWQLEGEMGERLGYLGIVPQPVDPPRLIWVPMCVLGLLVTVVFAVVGRLPAGAALALLGTAWSTVAATRWLWKLRFWPLFIVPLLIMNPGVAHLIHRAAGWGAAGAVSVALAICALAFQPRAYVGEPLSRRMEGASRVSRRGPRAGVARAAISAASRGATAATEGWWVVAAARFTLFAFGRFFFITVGGTFALVGAICPILGSHGNFLFWPILFVGTALAGAYSGNMHEFLHTRPVDRGPRLAGTVLPALLVVLAAPGTALCLLDLDWMNHAGLIGLFKPRRPADFDVGYLRAALGATFLPARWPADGLPADLWARLRPLLYLDALRVALLSIAMLFALPVPKVGESATGRRSVPPTNVVVLLAAFAAMILNGLAQVGSRWPIPRLWFLALLACVSIAHFAWRVRVVSTPSHPKAGQA